MKYPVLGLLALLLSGCAAKSPAPERQRHSRATLQDAGLHQPTGAVPSLESSSIQAQPASTFSRYQMLAAWNALRGDAYPLDVRERQVEDPKAKVQCTPEELVVHRGETVRFHGGVRVDPAFAERLSRFESVVAEVAQEVYGRAPTRIQHYGAYSCRSSRNRSYRLSEHALGNAIDVVGFDFGAAKKSEPLKEGLPRSLSRPFQVRVLKHWDPKTGKTNEIHSRFLRLLTERLIARGDVFRGFVGPGHRGHSDHLHFDMSPWRYVRISS